MYKYILISALLATFFSCGKNTVESPEKPKGLIPESKMVDIIYDMSLVSAAKGINKKTLENKGVFPAEFVYKKHGIDSIQFVESNAYYSYDIRVYQDIYTRVKERLENDKKVFSEIIELEKKKQDSIRAVNKKRDSIKKSKTKGRNRPNEKSDLSEKTEKLLKLNQ